VLGGFFGELINVVSTLELLCAPKEVLEGQDEQDYQAPEDELDLSFLKVLHTWKNS